MFSSLRVTALWVEKSLMLDKSSRIPLLPPKPIICIITAKAAIRSVCTCADLQIHSSLDQFAAAADEPLIGLEDEDIAQR